jgi:hypothetical protein
VQERDGARLPRNLQVEFADKFAKTPSFPRRRETFYETRRLFLEFSECTEFYPNLDGLIRVETG